MRQTLKRLGKMTVGYSLVTLLGPLFTIILTPLYTRVLAPADYGVVDVAIALSAFITTFALFGIDQALSVYFFDGDTKYRRNLVTTAVVAVGACGLLAGVVLAAVAEPVAHLLFKDVGRRYILYLLAINAVSVPVYSVIAAALRLQMGVKRVNLLGLSFLAATIASNVTFVLVFRLKATGVVAANVLASSLACGVGLLLGWRSLRGRFSRALLIPLARAGAGLLPGAFSFLLLAGVDRLLLTQFVRQSDLGLYSIANRLASMLYVLLSAAWNAWWPMALEMASTPDATRQYARMFEYFAAASMLLALGIGIFAPEILAVFTREAYVPAAPYALALMIYFGPIGFLASFFSIGLYVRKRTHLVSVAHMLAAAINIVLNLLLDPWIGVWGAVWATVLAGVVLLAATYVAGQQALPVPYRLGRVSILSAVYVGLVAVSLLAPTLNSVVSKMSAVFLFLITLPAMGIISRHQLKVGFDAIRYRLTRLTQPSR